VSSTICDCWWYLKVVELNIPGADAPALEEQMRTLNFGIAPANAILVSLAILDLGSGGRFGCGSLPFLPFPGDRLRLFCNFP